MKSNHPWGKIELRVIDWCSDLERLIPFCMLSGVETRFLEDQITSQWPVSISSCPKWRFEICNGLKTRCDEPSVYMNRHHEDRKSKGATLIIFCFLFRS